jgi:pimeloyl-ACP methyl ester carboxylesterase
MMLARAAVVVVVGTCLGAASATGPELEGAWAGAIDIGALQLRVVFRLARDGSVWNGTMVSVDQGGAEIAVGDVRLDGDRVTLTVPKALGQFEGTRVAPDRLRGTWQQGGQRFPLELVHTDRAPTQRRPQEPQPPFPYAVEEVSVSGPPGVTLACTLTRPRGAARPGAAVLLTGSGPQNRDEEIMGHKPLALLADALARQGVAALRCDDRGFGRSTGNLAAATTFDFADDAEAMLRYLGTRADLDGKRLGLIGHSEGGLIAPMVAARSPAARFVVLLAGPGLRGDRLVALQDERLLQLVGAAPAVQRDTLTFNNKVFALLVGEKDEAALPKKLRALWEARPASLRGDGESALPGERLLLSPWFRAYLRIDPKDYLGKLSCAVLAVNGGKDAQVVAKPNLEAIAAALAGKPDVTVRELPGLNHLLQTATTGSPREYATIEETMAPAALATVTTWVAARAAAPAVAR